MIKSKKWWDDDDEIDSDDDNLDMGKLWKLKTT